jgi:putative oxidoreductase
MNTIDQRNIAAHVLRVSLGVMYLAHSIVLKYFTFTLAGTAQYFVSVGLPAYLAYVVFAAEAVGGTLLLLGVQTRAVALSLIPILLGATWVHASNGWVFNANGGGWEYPVFLIIASVVTALLVPSSTRSDGGKELSTAHA